MGEEKSRYDTEECESSMIDDLRKANIVKECQEEFFIRSEKEYADGENKEESIDERHLEIERRDRIDERTKEDVIR